MNNFTVTIARHNIYDKSFLMYFDDWFVVEVDNDDVDHAVVEAMTLTLKELVEKHWDESLFESYYAKTKLDYPSDDEDDEDEEDEEEYNISEEYDDRQYYAELPPEEND